MTKAILLLTPCYITLLWSLVLLAQKKSLNNARWLLGIFMLLAFVNSLSVAIFFYGYYRLYAFMEILYVFARLSICPLFYIYVLILSTIEVRRRHQLMHFIPSIMLGLFSFGVTIKLSPEEQIHYAKTLLADPQEFPFDFNNMIGYKDLILRASRIIFVLQGIVYPIMSIFIANNYNRIISNYLSNIENREMRWIKNVSICGFLATTPMIVLTFIGKRYFLKHDMLLIVPSIYLSVVSFVIGFYGYRQRPVSTKLYDTGKICLDFEKEKYKILEIKMKTNLIKLFEEKKIYCLPDLKINTIAERLNTNRTYISRLINDEFGMNFNEFVNQYRVNDAKQMLLSDLKKQYTIEYIAEKSGFGSIASFLRVFKEKEGITPGKYRTKDR